MVHSGASQKKNKQTVIILLIYDLKDSLVIMSIQNCTISNYRMTVSYDGRKYLGWQRHSNKPTVQYTLEQAVEKLLNIRSAVRGSGRTDRGERDLTLFLYIVGDFPQKT